MDFPLDPAAPRPGAPHDKDVLAIHPALGTVFTCNRCSHIHLQLGELHVRTDLDGFQNLVVLLNRAAANYELWAERQRSAA